MSIRAEAEENLRVIRSLMEKATVYRAISAPSALVGGVLAVAVSSLLIYLQRDPYSAEFPSWTYFGLPWLGVLALTGAANVYFLWHDAKRRGDAFISGGMRLAIRALLPGFFVAGVFSAFLLRSMELLAPLAGIWVLCYGLALLATVDFAPRSIARLGWSFLLCGIGLTVAMLGFGGDFFTNPGRSANLIMGATFGLLHLIYAACTWPRRTAS